MTQRLAYTCARSGGAQRRLLMTALVAADPYLDATLEYMKVLADQGADIIELIFPFSDPTYHGAVIRRASTRAIREEVSWAELVELGQTFRQTHQTPVIVSSYYNRVLAHGVDAFVECLAEADFDGAMITDLPWEEGAELRQALARQNLACPSTASPTTSRRRFSTIAQASDELLIWTGHAGGSPTISAQDFAERMDAFDDITDLPVVASMKISTGADAQAVAKHCDGVLVGSALVWLIEGRGSDIIDSLGAFVSELRAGVDGQLPEETAQDN